MKVIKFWEKNRIITIIGIVAAFISVTYCITYDMPDYFGIEAWFAFLNNLSISYIAAFIFYILQVYKPEHENHKKAQVILNPLFLDLVRFVEITIACCRKYIKISEDGTISIDWKNQDQKVIYFIPTTDTDNSHRPAIKKTETDLKNIEKVFKSKIDEIKSRISFKECDPDILMALSKLEAINFFNSVFVSVLMFERTFIKFPDFFKEVDKFELAKDEFKNYCRITDKYDVRDAEDAEIAACEVIFYKDALQSKSANEFTEIALREYVSMQLKSFITDEKILNELLNSIFPIVLEKVKEKDNIK